MPNVKHVLIIGANFSNKGAEAMMKTVKQQLERKFGHVSCYMVCRQYEEGLAAKDGFIPVYQKQPPRLVRKMRSLDYRIKGKLYKLAYGKNKPWYFPFPFREIDKIMGRLDAVVDVSGFAYADSWGKPMITETTKLVEICRRKGIKFYFLPQAWGSFDQTEVAAALQRMLAKANGFYARDMVSRNYLAKAMGMPAGTVPMAPDIAFSFNGNGVSQTKRKPAYKTNERLLIGISPNLRVYEKHPGKEMDNGYVRLLMAISHYCIEKLGANVIFIPNEIFPDMADHIDDRHLCNILYHHLNEPDRSFIINGYSSAEEIKSYIGEVDVLVSSRFHALIFGLLQHKPVLAISWSHKYRELFGLFGLEEFVNESDAIADHQTVLSQLERLVAERQAFSVQISAGLPDLKNTINTLFDGMSV